MDESSKPGELFSHDVVIFSVHVIGEWEQYWKYCKDIAILTKFGNKYDAASEFHERSWTY